jgi:hypothetical protein
MHDLLLVLLVFGVGIEQLERHHLISTATIAATTKPTSSTFLKAFDRLVPRDERKYQAIHTVEKIRRIRMIIT